MKGNPPMNMPAWFFWALLSAFFAAGTALFAKIGIRGVDSDLATLVRTFIIFFVLAGYVAAVPAEHVLVYHLHGCRARRSASHFRSPVPFYFSVMLQSSGFSPLSSCFSAA